MVDFTLIHPSRGRSLQALNTYNYWKENASGKYTFEHLLSIDEDDPQILDYMKNFEGSSKIHVNNNNCVVEATNNAAKHATGKILIYLSDDFMCPTGWDEFIMDKTHHKQNENWLLKVNDCLQRFEVPVLTIPIMSQQLYQTLKYFWNPEYKSMWVDVDLYYVCKNNNWIINAPELNFTHLHYSIGAAPKDETYTRSDRHWDQGKAIYEKRKLLNFPL